MVSEAPGPINFTMFLTMFGEKLNGTDPEDVIKNAFACFDEENTGSFFFLAESAVILNGIGYTDNLLLLNTYLWS